MVLSEELWRNRFGADTQIVGKIVHFNDQPLTIVGVTPMAEALGIHPGMTGREAVELMLRTAPESV